MPYKTKEEQTKYNKEYALKNKERLTRYKAEYYELNKEKINSIKRDQNRLVKGIPIKEWKKQYAKQQRALHKDRINASNRKYKAKPVIKERARDRYLQTTYGITLAEYNKKFAEQDGRCAICEQRSSKNLNVDHVHFPVGTKSPSRGCTSDRVRGLLCNACNRLILGSIERRKTVPPRRVIENLIKYATKYPLRGEK